MQQSDKKRGAAMVSSEVRFVAQGHIEEACRLAGHPELYNRITLQWSPRAVARVGLACRQTMTITLSAKPWKLLDHDHRRETVFHEVAHLIAFVECGSKGWGHTPRWRHVMSRIGYPNADRCVSDEAARELRKIQTPRAKTRFLAYCKCTEARGDQVEHDFRMATGEHLLTSRVFKRLDDHKCYYRCSDCRTMLSTKGEKIRIKRGQ